MYATDKHIEHSQLTDVLVIAHIQTYPNACRKIKQLLSNKAVIC